MSFPLFSVVVPVYNAKLTLSTCLDSVLRQTFPNFELICIDDGSQDNSWEILCQYMRKDCRVHAVSQENRGPADARNVGISFAAGEYILFLDSDDFLPNCSMLEVLSEEIYTANPDMLCYSFQSLTSDKKILSSSSHPFNGRGFAPDIFKEALETNSYQSSACTKAVRRTILESSHLYFSHHSVGEDILWCAELMLHVNYVVFLPHVFYTYQYRAMSRSHDISLESLKALLHILTELVQRLERSDFPSAFYNIWLNYVAFQYCTLLTNYCFCTNPDKESLIPRISNFSSLLSFTLSWEGRLISFVYRHCGFRFCIFLLNFYLNIVSP